MAHVEEVAARPANAEIFRQADDAAFVALSEALEVALVTTDARFAAALGNDADRGRLADRVSTLSRRGTLLSRRRPGCSR